MPEPTDPRDEASEEALSLLGEGLGACRKIVAGYRDILREQQGQPQRQEVSGEAEVTEAPPE